jgi:hypothetical protein
MRRHLWAVVGLVLLGLCVWLVLPLRRDDDFGWFAYTPADWCQSWDDNVLVGWSYTTDLLVMSQRQIVGSVVGILGLLVITSGIAFRLGQRRGQ